MTDMPEEIWAYHTACDRKWSRYKYSCRDIQGTKYIREDVMVDELHRLREALKSIANKKPELSQDKDRYLSATLIDIAQKALGEVT